MKKNHSHLSRSLELFFLLGFIWSAGYTQTSDENILSVSIFDEYGSVGYSDLWGWTAPDGHEYAILHPLTGTSIVDLETSPHEEIGFIPGSNSIWHDTKTYKNYAYSVSDQGNQGLQIIDLSTLPASVSLTKTWYGEGGANAISTVHNIHIDTSRGILFLTGQGTMSVHLIDITDPLNPVTRSQIPGESHDMCVSPDGQLLAVATGRTNSISFWNIQDINNPAPLSSVSVGSGYSNNCWFNDDNVHMASAVETVGGVVRFWDTSPVRTGGQAILTDTWIADASIIASDVFYEGNVLYVSHNTLGIWMLDTRNPSDIQVLGHHDPSTSSTTFGGTWGVYPWFASGRVIHSDVQRGLFVITPDPDIIPVNGYFGAVQAPGNLTYSRGTSLNYPTGNAIPSNTLSYTGSTATSISITPSLPGGLQFNTSNGTISGTPTGVSSARNYQVIVANDAGADTITLNIEVNYVQPSNLAYANGLSHSYTVNSAISANVLSYSGSPATSITISPALPAGLNINSEGTISGTPTQLIAADNYTVTVNNQAGEGSIILNIAVQVEPLSNLQYSEGTNLVYSVNSLITPNTLSYNGHAADTVYLSQSLPVGLSMNTQGTISGTPSQVTSVAAYMVFVQNPAGLDSVSLNIEIIPQQPGDLEFSQGTILRYFVGEPIPENHITYSGSPHTSLTISPALPGGLELDEVTGIISGTPTEPSPAGNYIVTVANQSGAAISLITIEVSGVVGTSGRQIPQEYDLTSISPNPIATYTSISFNVPENPAQTGDLGFIAVYNLQGTRVKTLLQGRLRSGYRTLVYDGTDEKGKYLREGIYLLKMSAPGFNRTLKMTVLR